MGPGSDAGRSPGLNPESGSPGRHLVHGRCGRPKGRRAESLVSQIPGGPKPQQTVEKALTNGLKSPGCAGANSRNPRTRESGGPEPIRPELLRTWHRCARRPRGPFRSPITFVGATGAATLAGCTAPMLPHTDANEHLESANIATSVWRRVAQAAPSFGYVAQGRRPDGQGVSALVCEGQRENFARVNARCRPGPQGPCCMHRTDSRQRQGLPTWSPRRGGMKTSSMGMVYTKP